MTFAVSAASIRLLADDCSESNSIHADRTSASGGEICLSMTAIWLTLCFRIDERYYDI